MITVQGFLYSTDIESGRSDYFNIEGEADINPTGTPAMIGNHLYTPLYSGGIAALEFDKTVPKLAWENSLSRELTETFGVIEDDNRIHLADKDALITLS
ncbi:hypothetical protein [Haloarcula argentinensis]|uniref:Uncharacterized protein n=1 Tax=Haloarcula argentinensis TaxID=43776 RepID=A0A830FWU3_HALAR|nr:hypothetical protein [Haloarcula argentinensis]MDS0255876.1 hypothetical protein [Haloarcula argentinensis]GGM49626.1 hypothetical protein GCM10009006_33570 [Haloarcula argentinensis]